MEKGRFFKTLLIIVVFLFNYSYKGITQESELYQLDIEELWDLSFSTATKIEVPFDETIGTSYLLDKATIKKRGYQSLKDLLEHIPGFVVLHRDIQYVASVRGLNANDNLKMTLMINGIETIGINEPDFLNGPISLDDVEKVEIIVGPSSFFEPANTLAATINVITDKKEGASIYLTKGTDVDYRLTASAGNKWQDNIWANTQLSLEQRLGFSAFDEKTISPSLQATEGHNWIAASSFQYHFVTQVKFKDWYVHLQALQVKHPLIPFRGIAVINPNAGPEYSKSSYLEQIYSAKIKKQKDWGNNLKSFVSVMAASRSESKDPRFHPDAEWRGIDYNLEIGGNKKLGANFMQTGIQLAVDDHNAFIDNDGVVYLDGYSNAIGLYLSNTTNISTKINTVIAFRADRNTILPAGKWYYGGRAAIVFSLFDSWTTKIMANHVVKMPSALAGRMEIWGSNNDSIVITGNDTIIVPAWARQNPTAQHPEQLTTYEWQNIVYFANRRSRASLTIYYQNLQDFISWGGPWTNLGDFRGWGLEGDIRYRPNERIDYWINSSWLNSEFHSDSPDVGFHVSTDSSNRMIGSPRLTITSGASIKIIDNMYLSPSVRHMTQQASFDVDLADFKDIGNRYYIDVSFLWHNSFTVKGLELRIRARNLLNNRDYISGSWQKGKYKPRGIHGNISLAYTF